jgi:hypothetical protein
MADHPMGDYLRGRNQQQRTQTVLEAARKIAANRGVTTAQVALTWLAARPAVSSVILGARTLEQLTANLPTGMTLSTEETELLEILGVVTQVLGLQLGGLRGATSPRSDTAVGPRCGRRTSTRAARARRMMDDHDHPERKWVPLMVCAGGVESICTQPTELGAPCSALLPVGVHRGLVCPHSGCYLRSECSR